MSLNTQKLMLLAMFLTACGGQGHSKINISEKARLLKAHMADEDSFVDGQEREPADDTSDGSNDGFEDNINDDGGTDPNDNGNDGGGTKPNDNGNDGSGTKPNDNGNDGSGTKPNDNGNDDSGTKPNDNGNDGPGYHVQGNDTIIDVTRICRGAKNMPNVSDAEAITVTVKEKYGKVLCKANGAQVRADILKAKKIKLSNCNLSKLPQDAKILVTNENGNLVTQTQTAATNTGFQLVDKPFQILAAMMAGDIDSLKNRNLSLMVQDGMSIPAMKSDPLCDTYMTSPLVVDMRPRAQLRKPFKMTAPIEGVDFDILDKRSDPLPHSTKRISWVMDPQVMFIVLPNKSGKVTGIDELFGDNTYGPDKQFASNGFTALAKHDSNKDGVISKQDPVFAKLRLWSDKNLDGKAQTSELFLFSQYSITVIDLNYDPNYYHRDSYGNEVKYKSVVLRENNGRDELRPVFDIWFVINEDIQR